MKIHKEHLDERELKLIRYFSFLMGFAQAVLAYVMSSYFEESFHMENVGIFYSVGYALVLVILLNLHKIVEKFGKTEIFFATFIVRLIILGFLAVIDPSPWGGLLLIIYIVAGNVNWVVLDIILESFSSDKMSGRIRGIHLMILDMGFMLGPILSTQLLVKFDFQVVFLASLVIDTAVIFIAAKSIKHVNHAFHGVMTVKGILGKLLHRPNIMRIYYISFVLEFFYAIMLIFMPIYLRDIGIPWTDIGIIFTIMLVPFVIFPYPAGYLADKKWGEKEMLIGAVFVMAGASLSAFYISSKSVIIWGLVLLMTRIGASLIQTLRDSYFYKRIDGEDVDLINFYRTSMAVAYIIAPAMAFILLGGEKWLWSLDVRYVFLMLAVVVFSGLYSAFRLTDNKCEAELESCNK